MGYREGTSERYETRRRFHRSDSRVLRPAKADSDRRGPQWRGTGLPCIGRTECGILTIRFTYRGETIRIIGAGYWRKGRKTYEKENAIES